MGEHEFQDESFDDLLERVRSGDEAAASRLVQLYEGIVRRSVRSRLGRPMRRALDSMDVVQSVHRSLLIGMRHEKFAIRSPDDLVGLALVMVRRKVARQWRRIKARPDARAESSPEADFSDNPDRPGGDPAAAVLADDALEAFLAEVDDTDRKLVHLRLDGHSTTEAAGLLGLDPKFLRVRLMRLRKKIRDRGLLDPWL